MASERHLGATDERANRQDIDLPVIVALSLAAFVGVVNVMAPAPFIDDLAADLDTSVPLAGQAVSIALLMAGFVGMVAGPLADHVGHRRVLLAGVACAGLSALGTALAPDYLSFMAMRALGGFGSSMTIGVSFGAAAALYAGPARRRAVSLIAGALSLGTALGPPALTSTSVVFGWRGAFGVIAGAALLGFVATLLLFPVHAPHASGRFELGRLFDSYRPLLRDRQTILLYAVWTLRSVCWLGALSFLGAFFSERHDYSTRAIGLAFMLGGIGFMLGSLAAGGRLGAFDLRPLSGLSLLGMALGWVLLFTLPLPPIAALGVLLLTTIASGVAQVGVLTLIADRTPAGPSTTMVLTETVLSFGAALGGATGGILLVAGGFIALGVGLPLAALAGAVIIARRESSPPAALGHPQPT